MHRYLRHRKIMSAVFNLRKKSPPYLSPTLQVSNSMLISIPEIASPAVALQAIGLAYAYIKIVLVSSRFGWCCP